MRRNKSIQSLAAFSFGNGFECDSRTSSWSHLLGSGGWFVRFASIQFLDQEGGENRPFGLSPWSSRQALAFLGL
jgi:hypothetical protein